MLETDAPYLTPVPYRGKRNEPAYIKYIVQEIANIERFLLMKWQIQQQNAKQGFSILMKERLDKILVDLGYFDNKSKASAAVLAGNVKIKRRSD